MAQTRRSFLRHTALASVAVAPPFQLIFSRRATAAGSAGFGPLVADPNGILDLPAGFSYTILQEAGDPLSDGYRMPILPDAMAAFVGAQAGTVVLMRNHEINGLNGGAYDRDQIPAEAYSTKHAGGVTRLVIDTDTLAVQSSNLVLAGTLRNCAGGTSPFGWLSCEEPGLALLTEPDHGFVFLADAAADNLQAPARIPGYGRFNHEAATMDPATKIAYLTEDSGSGLFYRFVPTDPAQPFVGVLQALRVVGDDGKNTGAGLSVGDTFEIDWVDIDDPLATSEATQDQGRRKGAARFVRGEGLWLHNGAVYFSCTEGGPNDGQIFKLMPAGDGGVLELIAQSPGASVLDKPDNITVAPWGDVFMAEDGNGEDFIRGLSPAGEIFDFARNRLSSGELAGVCFSPDGQILFFNMQVSGLTFAVTGPFPDGDFPPDGETTAGGDGDTTTTTGGDATTGGDGSATTGGGEGEPGGCAAGGQTAAAGFAVAVGVAITGGQGKKRRHVDADPELDDVGDDREPRRAP